MSQNLKRINLIWKVISVLHLIIEEDIWQIRRPENMPSNNLSFKYYFYFNEPFSQAYEINQMSLATKDKAKFLHLKTTKLNSNKIIHCCRNTWHLELSLLESIT
jgi:hypothetical protein